MLHAVLSNNALKIIMTIQYVNIYCDTYRTSPLEHNEVIIYFGRMEAIFESSITKQLNYQHSLNELTACMHAEECLLTNILLAKSCHFPMNVSVGIYIHGHVMSSISEITSQHEEEIAQFCSSGLLLICYSAAVDIYNGVRNDDAKNKFQMKPRVA
jgi:hypothetical protein